MNLIILSGGLGTRLHSISNGLPKALMPVGDAVYLDCLLERVFNYDITHVYFSLHYKPQLFQDYILQSDYSEKLTAVVEPKPLGTGGAITYVVENTNISSPFFAINGDSVSIINFNRMAKEFDNNDFKAMIGISEVEYADRYGTVALKHHKVSTFNEKGIGGAGWINNGHYIFNKEAFNGFSGTFSLEKDLFPALAEKGELGVYRVENDHFIDMGIPEDYEKLCKMYQEQK